MASAGRATRGRRQFQMRGGVGATMVAESMAMDAAMPPPAPAVGPGSQMAKMAGNLERDERKDKKEDAGASPLPGRASRPPK